MKKNNGEFKWHMGTHTHTLYQPTKHYNFPSRNETTTIVE